MPDSDRPEGAASEAVQTLTELAEIRRRSRRAATTGLTRIPLTTWGFAWLTGYLLLDLAPWRVAVPVGSALAVGAVVVTWALRSQEVRTSRTARVGAGWLVVMGSSPFLLAVVSPDDGRVEALFLGTLWGVAMTLFAVATADRPFALLGAAVVLTGPFSRVLAGPHSLAVFGVVGGAGMLSLGVWRTWRSR